MKLWKRCAALLLALTMIGGLSACGGQAGKDALQARYAVLYRDPDGFLQTYLDDPETYKAQIDSFGVDDFAATFADTDAFNCYNAEISVGNGNDFAVTILDLQVKDKNVGKGGVYLGTLGDGASIGLPAHFDGENAMYYPVIASASLTDEQVLKALSAQKVVVRYINAADDADSVQQAQENGAQILESVISYQ